MPSRRDVLAGAAALSTSAGLAGPVAAAVPEVFQRNGVAIGGYDPVAYFVDGRPVPGARNNSVVWTGAEWRFASPANRLAFEENPTRFAPRYGGYCAYAVSRNYTAKTEPEAWRIVDGRLYLNYSLRVRRIWERDVPGNIARADANWPGVLSL